MQSYSMNVERETKIFTIVLEGTVQKSDIINYVEDFKKNLSTINPAEYQLNFKASGFKVLTQDLVPMLKSCFEMYKQAGFKKIKIDMGGNVVQKMQVNRVINSIGFNNVEIV